MKKKSNVKVIIGFVITFLLGTIISAITATYAATTLSGSSVYYNNSNSGGSSTTVSGALDELYAAASDQDILMAKILDRTYPVGSVYISTTDSTVEMVQERFGGTWVKYASGTTLVSDDGTNYITNNATKGSGGSKTATLSVSNLPSHSHNITPSGTVTSTFKGSEVSTNSAGNHSHNFYENYKTNAAFGYLQVRNYAATDNSTPIEAQQNGIQIAGIKQLNATAAAQVVINENGSHTHTVTASGTVTSTFKGTAADTSKTGSGTSFSVQDPYTVVYMYKRTA